MTTMTLEFRICDAFYKSTYGISMLSKLLKIIIPIPVPRLTIISTFCLFLLKYWKQKACQRRMSAAHLKFQI